MLVAAVLAGPASAHDFWIVPSTFRPAPGAEVSLALRVGTNLAGEAMPRVPQLIERFTYVTAAGETPVPGKDLGDPAGAVRAAPSGLSVVAYQSHPHPVEIDPATFEHYLGAEGLEWASADRAKKGESRKAVKERFARCAKAFLVSGSDARAGVAFDRNLGFTLEVIALKNPYALRAGDEFPVRVLYRGKPAANLLVVGQSPSFLATPPSARTDRDGRATLRLPGPGFWLVKAVTIERAPAGSGFDWQSWWASLTFDLAAR